MKESDSDPSNTHAKQKITDLDEDSKVILNQAEREPSPRPKQRKSGETQLKPRSRTSNACEPCRKRKTKCSGPPGPCGICRNLDTPCVFTPRSHTRRKRANSSDSLLERQRYILHATFLILKHSSLDEIQTLLRLIRNNARPEDTIRCMKANLLLLQNRGLVEVREIDDHDFLAVATPALMDSGKPKVRPAPSVGSWVSDLDLSNSTQEMMEDVVVDNAIVTSPNRTDKRGILPENPLTYDNPTDFFEAMGLENIQPPYQMSPSDSSTFNVMTPQKFSSATPSTENSFLRPNSAFEYRTTLPLRSTYEAEPTWESEKSSTSRPESVLNRSALDFISRIRQLMSTGRSLNELNNFGTANCELLFRDRTGHDRATIPNWACETARFFPVELALTMRIALALSLMRMMPYLISPSPDTMRAVPGMLRPTNLQKRTPHNVEYSFIPIPKFRDCFIDDPKASTTTWLAELIQHQCYIAWPHFSREEVYMSSQGFPDTAHGQWMGQQQHFGLTKDGLDPYSNAISAKMIVHDLDSGEVQISEHFERACWTFDNWSISKHVLDTWPDLGGHIKVY